MARPPRNEIATKEFHKALGGLKKRRPPRSADEVRLWGYKEFDILVSDETIRRAFVGEVDPTQCQVELLFLLKAWFEADITELGTYAEQRMRAVLKFGGEDPTPDLRIRQSPWTKGGADGGLATVTPIKQAG